MGKLTITPVSAVIGAEVGGVDLSMPVDDATFETIHQAWLDHGVLVFPGQSLTDPQLERFSARFGPLDRKPLYTNEVVDTTTSEFVCVISNVKIDGKPIGDLGDGEAVWHTDMSYQEHPPTAALLYALELPPSGGETGFANMVRAYEALPEALKTRIDNLQCKHDATRNSAGGLRSGMPVVTDPRSSPGTPHPLVRMHPKTGRLALFLGRRRHAYIVGLPLEESEKLLNELWAHASQPRFAWHHSWRLGDLLLWDNRSVMHRRNAFDPSTRRLMHRTQIKGDRPFRRREAQAQTVHA